jgi:hypothetical protein
MSPVRRLGARGRRTAAKIFEKFRQSPDIFMGNSTEIQNEETRRDGLLDHIQAVIETARNHGLSPAFFDAASGSLAALAQTLRISEFQAALLSLLIENTGERPVSASTLAESLKCGKIQMLKYMDDFEALEKKHIICRTVAPDFFNDRYGGQSFPSYTVPFAVLDAIRRGRAYTFTGYDNLTPHDFFNTADDILQSLRRSEINKALCRNELLALFAANKKCAFVTGIKKYHDMKFHSTVALLIFCIAIVIYDDDESVPLSKIRAFINHDICKAFERGSHQLFQLGLIEFDNDRGFSDRINYRLTEEGRNLFLKDTEDGVSSKNKDKLIIAADSLESRPLFYPEKITRRISELSALLREEQFVTIKKHLADNKMPTVFSVLFYGPPGTGKTETVYQISRQTGRDILRVDISETKSKWFGESEKIIKNLFNRYRNLLKNTKEKPAPILLFNEADGVLGKRMELGDSRSGPAQTENAIQNIILQEMEELEGGILIATTNMTTNLDRAFERRFLYKLEFEKPDNAARRLIWLDKIPKLTPEDIDALSDLFDFSGGQIENIARKHTIQTLLSGRRLSLDEIKALCEEETLDTRRQTKIGFKL